MTTPHLARAGVWETSGHLAKYRGNMYPAMVEEEGGEYFVKPMNCPLHVLIYKSQTRSYRDLPIRMSELGHGVPLRAAGDPARPDADPRADHR